MKVFLQTFGCRANQYDSERVRALVERGGGEIVADPSDADAAVFNSCAVTTEAEVDLRKSVRRAARRNPSLRTVVMGCAAALDGGALRALPTVQRVVSGDDVDAVADWLGLAAGVSGARAQSGTRALLRIQDGCDEHCTFCATTLARGGNRSRAPNELVDEAAALAERHPEIVLTGVHIGTYGRDTGTTLGALVAVLVNSVPRVRFRLSSVEATEVDSELRELFDHPTRLAPHLHAPLQSGSDRVLRRMGRHWYTAGSYAAAVARTVAGREPFALGADVIAGFPGETEDEHRETLNLVRDLPFTYLHVFPFSLRPGTAASHLRDHLSGDVVQRRARELRAAAGDRNRAYRARRLGGRADVIVIRGDRREGLTEDFLPVSMGDAPLPRGSRVQARLAGTADQLLALPSQGSFPT
jgi:threonylcarbamoyladenosine tRNA methylthiotransferase MtaB